MARMFPQTPAAAAALSVATRFYSPALLNHCVRSYLWGAAYAGAHGIAFDDELYYVSALLHDIALTDPFGATPSLSASNGAVRAWAMRKSWRERREPSVTLPLRISPVRGSITALP